MSSRYPIRLLRLTTIVALLIISTACSEDGESGETGGQVGTGGAAGRGGAGGGPGDVGGSGGTAGTPLLCGDAINFEEACGPYTFVDFGGGAATVVDNPDRSGIDTTRKVARMQKFAGEVFGGSTLVLQSPLDWAEGAAFKMKVWSSRVADVLFKLEGLQQERSDVQTGSSGWEELCFDFTGSTDGDDETEISLIFDLGRVGNAGADPDDWTFYFDDIVQVESCDASSVQYELVFADEFDVGDSPSPEKWTIETGYGPNGDGWGNNEWQLYTDSAANVRVEGGNLVLSAQCFEAPCGVRDGSITSGKINSLGKFDFRFGRVEARIKPPVGRGAWPAFWSLGVNYPAIGWPRSGEIDFMEVHNAFSNDRTTHFTMHWCDESVNPSDPCSPPALTGWVYYTQSRRVAESLGDDFHLFEAEWNEHQIVGKIDGVTYFAKAIHPDTMGEFLEEFYLILNVAMGGTLGSNNQPPNGSETFPQTMLVDYVRVYQAVDAGGS